jgi:hypothetical protein
LCAGTMSKPGPRSPHCSRPRGARKQSPNRFARQRSRRAVRPDPTFRNCRSNRGPPPQFRSDQSGGVSPPAIVTTSFSYLTNSERSTLLCRCTPLPSWPWPRSNCAKSETPVFSCPWCRLDPFSQRRIPGDVHLLNS